MSKSHRAPIPADYGFRAYHSRLIFQRFWQRRKVYEVFSLVGEDSFVLDLGSGSAMVSGRLARQKGCSVMLLDSDFSTARHAHRRWGLPAVCADGLHIPFREEVFDVVLSIEVLEHVRDPVKYLVGARRVLSRGGRFILTTPNYASLFLLIGEIWDRFGHARGYMKDEHVTRFTQRMLEEIVKAAGFRVARIRKILGLSALIPIFKPEDARISRFDRPMPGMELICISSIAD